MMGDNMESAEERTWDPPTWLMASGGPKKGHVIGAGRADPSFFLGASTDRHDASISSPSPADKLELQQLRQQVEEYAKTASRHEEQLKYMTEILQTASIFPQQYETESPCHALESAHGDECRVLPPSP